MVTDSHAHLTAEKFAKDLDEVIQRANDAGVHRIISNATSLKDAQEVRKLAEKYESVYYFAGIHPEDVAEDSNQDIPKLLPILDHPKCLGVGEIGLDFRWIEYIKKKDRLGEEYVESQKQLQKKVFETQLNIAFEKKLPVVVHNRDSDDSLKEILAPFVEKGLAGLLHSFTGEISKFKELIEAGWLFSFNGIITFKNGQNVRDILNEIPIQNIIVETDAPYLAPEPHRGKRCEPAFVIETANKVSELKEISPAAGNEVYEQNLERVFSRLVNQL